MDHPIKTGISYFGNRNPRHFAHDLEDIRQHNCTFIVHTFSENDQQFYKDTMAEMVSQTKDAGLECYLDPWGVGHVFGGETYSSFALNYPDTLQILPDGIQAPAACFNHPRFREFMRTWIEDAAELGADVLFWDEPHFYINLRDKKRFPLWYCRCQSCNDKFRQRHRQNLEEAERAQIVAFREDCVVEFLTELCALTRAKGMQNAICLLPFQDASIGLSDWSRVAAIESVDVFGTDPYWMFFNEDIGEFVGRFAREVTRLCSAYGKEPQLWIQAYNIYAGREDELKQAIDIAWQEGIRNFAAWSYLGNAYMSYNRSENPERVWQVIGDAYAELLAESN